MSAAPNIYTWTGTDKSGRKTKGEITSANVNTAKQDLRKKGVNATQISKKGVVLQAFYPWVQRSAHKTLRYSLGSWLP